MNTDKKIELIYRLAGSYRYHKNWLETNTQFDGRYWEVKHHKQLMEDNARALEKMLQGEKVFTKADMMYVTGYANDEETFDNLTLLGGDAPEDGDWLDVMREWYEDLCKCSTYYQRLYHELKEQVSQGK